MEEKNVSDFFTMLMAACPDIVRAEIHPRFSSEDDGPYALVIFSLDKPFSYEQVAEAVRVLGDYFGQATYDNVPIRLCCNHGHFAVWQNGVVTPSIKQNGDVCAYRPIGILSPQTKDKPPTKQKRLMGLLG